MLGSKSPQFNFSVLSSASPFTVTSQSYLESHPDSKFTHIATGAIVFDPFLSTDPRILLIQRSAHDSWPNCWEIPGGACDDADESILHGVARELWEESGLFAAKIGPLVDDVHLFSNRSGKKIGKFIFLTEVENSNDRALEVKLCPDEHQSFVWASENEVKARKAGDIKLEFPTPDLEATILRAFEMKRNGEY